MCKNNEYKDFDINPFTPDTFLVFININIILLLIMVIK